MPFHLLKNEPLGPGLRRIAQEQIAIGLNDTASESMKGARGIHSLRIRCKKLRGLLRLSQPLMGEVFIFEDLRIREAAKLLSGNRDAEVIAKTIAALKGKKWDREEKPVSVPEQNLRRSRQILSDCVEAVEDWPLDLHGFYDISPGFALTYRNALDAWEQVLALQSDHNFHRLRRWGKYHWYHIRILERLNKPRLRKRRNRLRKLQLALGDAHDLVLLQAYLGVEEHADEPLLEMVRARKKALYEQALKTGEKIFAVPVSTLVADLSRDWADHHDARCENELNSI
jgi:CHAD domain-containing protein